MSKDSIECPKCGSWKTYFDKSWKITSPRSGSVITVKMYRCTHCRKGFRMYE